MDVTLEFLNAAYGDAILVLWGDPPHLAIVDGGPTGSFELALGPRLEQLLECTTSGEPLVVELVSVSHIDDDHIAGVVRFLGNIRRRSRDGLPPATRSAACGTTASRSSLRLGPTALRSRTSPPSRPDDARVRRHRRERQPGPRPPDLARALGVAGNQPFGGPVIGGSSTTIAGLVLTISAPDPHGPREPGDDLAGREGTQGPERAGGRLRRSLGSEPVQHVHRPRWPARPRDPDAHARGDRILSGLEAVGLLPQNGSVHVDVLQVPHHGASTTRMRSCMSGDRRSLRDLRRCIHHKHPDPYTVWSSTRTGSMVRHPSHNPIPPRSRT